MGGPPRRASLSRNASVRGSRREVAAAPVDGVEAIGCSFRSATVGRMPPVFLPLPAQRQCKGHTGEVSPCAPRRNSGSEKHLWIGPVEMPRRSAESVSGRVLLGGTTASPVGTYLPRRNRGFSASYPDPPGKRPRLTETVDRLIDFNSALNKPDEVSKWRKERANFGGVAPTPPGEKMTPSAKLAQEGGVARS
jgi:hypothetical protein